MEVGRTEEGRTAEAPMEVRTTNIDVRQTAGRLLTTEARGWHMLQLLPCACVSVHDEIGCLPCARPWHTAKGVVCRVFSSRYTLNPVFVMCLTKCIRQNYRHTANYRFPIVTAPLRRRHQLFFSLSPFQAVGKSIIVHTLPEP